MPCRRRRSAVRVSSAYTTMSSPSAWAGQNPTTAFGRNHCSATILSSIAGVVVERLGASANSGSVSTSGNFERMPQVRKNGVQSM
jgi:hypothetical protein